MVPDDLGRSSLAKLGVGPATVTAGTFPPPSIPVMGALKSPLLRVRDATSTGVWLGLSVGVSTIMAEFEGRSVGKSLGVLGGDLTDW